MTGTTGATGTATENLAAVNNNDTRVSGNGLLSLFQNVANSGDSITHIAGSPFVEITKPGLYEVYYQTKVQVESDAYPVIAETVVVYDGETLPHSQDHAKISSEKDEELMSGYAIFYAEQPSTLFLKNTLENTHFIDTILFVKKAS